MSIKVEAAVITQKGFNAEFNCDSVNINGKVLPREVILKGYKGAGVMSESVFFALSHSDIEGFADAAVAAFNDRAAGFKKGLNAAGIINGFFGDSVSALYEMNKKSSDLVCSVLYASGRSVLIGKTGDTSVYNFSQGSLTKVDDEKSVYDDGQATYGLASFNNVLVDDIFIMLSPGVSKILSEKDIADICRLSDGSVKKIVNLINKVSLAKENESSSSVIAVKILEVDTMSDDELDGFVNEIKRNIENTMLAEEERTDSVIETEQKEEPVQEYSTGLAALIAPDGSVEEPEFENVLLSSDDTLAWLDSDNKEKNGGDNKKSTKIIIAVVAAVAAVAVIAVIAFSGKLFNKKPAKPEKETKPVTTTEEETEPESTTVDEESTTEEETTTEAETTTSNEGNSSYTYWSAPERTTSRPVYTTSVPTTSSTTAAPVTDIPESSSQDSTEASSTAPQEPATEPSSSPEAPSEAEPTQPLTTENVTVTSAPESTAPATESDAGSADVT